jgi:hypothetical protein
MSGSPEPWGITGLYQQLAAQRAERARAALEHEGDVDQLFAQSAGVLEAAAGTLINAADTFIAIEGALPSLFAEQAGALLAVAARFEEAADLARTRDRG